MAEADYRYVERYVKFLLWSTGGFRVSILRVCNEILRDEYPELAAKCNVTLPDEKMRRVGQSVAAACLPVVVK